MRISFYVSVFNYWYGRDSSPDSWLISAVPAAAVHQRCLFPITSLGSIRAFTSMRIEYLLQRYISAICPQIPMQREISCYKVTGNLSVILTGRF